MRGSNGIEDNITVEYKVTKKLVEEKIIIEGGVRSIYLISYYDI